MTNKKIQFVSAGSNRKPVYFSGRAPPLAFLSIATYSGLEMELLDSEVIPQEEIKRKIDCNILAGSINLTNYQSFLQLAQEYKEKNPNCEVIVGGPHAFLAHKILRNRKYIDAVIVGDGEKAFTMYAKDEDLSQIPNLVYRRGGKIIQNPKEILRLEELPIPERSLVSMKHYFNGFSGDFKRPMTMYSERGCFWGRCVFCQVKRPARSRTPEQFWQEIRYLQDNFMADYVWDVSDSPNKERFIALSKNKPKDINTKLRFYARASEIDEETVKALNILNCYEIFLGLETGDPGMLRKIGKNSSLEQYLRAVEILAGSEIKPRISFVLGLPNENDKSLENTYRFARHLIDSGANSIACSILTPVPCSESFTMMLSNQELCKKYAQEDLFDILEFQKEWVSHFCKISHETLLNAVEDFERLLPKNFSGAFRGY